MKTLEKHPILFLTIACIAIFFFHLDAIYINIMEARNFITAREMIDDGNWLLTTLNGEPRYQKPPLPTWLTAASGMVFGLKSMFGLRLPAALMSLLLVLTSYRLGKRLAGDSRYAFISALILATSFYIIFSGRNGQWDIFTHAFMMVAIYQIFRWFQTQNKRYVRALWAGLFLGLSFMSKGPVSMYALFLPFLIAFGMTFRFRSLRKNILPIVLFLITAVVASGWWHWYVYTFDAEAVAEITRREAANWTGYNVRPFYYYWSFFTQSGIWTLPAFIALLYPYLKDRVSDKRGYQFTLIWTLAAVVLLSIIPEKKSRYLLPVLIPMALNTGYYVEYLFRKFRNLSHKGETLPVYFNFGLIAVIGLAFPIAGYIVLKEQLDGQWFWFVLLSVSLVTIGILMIRHLRWKRIRPVFYLTIAFIIAIISFGMPMASALTVNPEYRPLSELQDWQANTELPVYELGGFTPELIWEYGKPIPVLTQDGVTRLPKEESFGLLVAEENIPVLEQQFPKETYSVEKIIRYDMNPVAPDHRNHKPRLYRDLYLITKR